ncbi:MAG: MMPL family transporter [Candidatus Saccharibacteria bacterium]|nr:MMPL family transporter [Candidatus Saccharibacteria bacterium]
MRKISDFIVNHCYVIFAVFLALTGLCGFLATQVNINKDIYSYMPADSETSRGLAIMNDEFDYSATSSYEMMLADVSAEEKQAIKEYIESIDGVKSVDYDETEEYNRDQYTRYMITINDAADSKTAERVYSEIHDKYVAQYEIAESGQVYTFNGAVLKLPVALLSVFCAMVILFAMSKSWFEPILFLFCILLAVIVNKGTNIIFPSVSHITDAICAILQMALSMDYVIMLSTRYRQEKAKPDHPDKYTAMRRAMRYSFGAITSSSVTTVVGLLMLIFMSFTIGRDMGLVLSKGVILSLVSIFTTLPALLLFFDKWVEKTAKKTLTFKMDWFGKNAFCFRKIAVPAFLIIFAGAFMLKGSTTIDFTSAQNNKIKDVFSETNQIALVYDSRMDEQVTELCKKLDKQKETTRVLCYGNTINEPEKYNELIPAVRKLSNKDVNLDDYLMKALYYRYYKDVDAHMISLGDFVNFLQRDVFPSDHFSDLITDDIVVKVDQFSYFTDQKKVNQPRTKAEIAKILGVDPAKLDSLFVLYFSEQEITTKLTTYQFASFAINDILTNPEYASMIGASQKADLAKLLTFSNSNITNTSKTAAELSKLFGIDQALVEKVFLYYNFTTTTTPTVSASVEELVNFALTNEEVLAQMGLTKEQAATIKQQITNAKSNISVAETELNKQLANLAETNPELAAEIQQNLLPEIQKIKATLAKSYSYSEIASVATNINSMLTKASEAIKNIENSDLVANLDPETKAQITNATSAISAKISDVQTNINMADKLEKLQSIYRLYQAEKTANATKLSAKELVNFLVAHAGDAEIKSAMNPSVFQQLKLAQFIINNQSVAYSYGALANSFNLDANLVKLVYAFYEYRHASVEPTISLKNLVNFIDEKVLPNPTYASHLGESEQSKLAALAVLMRSAQAGVLYNQNSLYRAISPLAGDFDKNTLYLAYLYHGSLYDYDENWTLTIETFINYVADKIVPDSHFANLIDDDKKQTVIDGRKMINDAKDMLVGPNHYRALIETELPAEGNETFSFIRDIKETLGDKYGKDYFVLGDSPMAYEMSQTFGGEMDFITIITMLAIFAVVVCTFKSVFISLLLVFVIQCAVYIVMAYLSLTGSSIYFIALIIVQAILMGATIDYAILFTSYYLENRNYFKLSVKDALINTYNKSINAILTSASILIIVTAIVGNFTSAIAGKICQSISLGTFCATVIILVLLPALLATLDKLIVKKRG